MEHPYILPYIHQRMKELGFEKYHFEAKRITFLDAIEPVSEIFYNTDYYTPYARPIQFRAGIFYLMAHNEFYFLVEKTIPSTLSITSDVECLSPTDASSYTNQTFFNFKEFTGQIFFSDTGSDPINIEFIKCTPYE